MLMAGGSARKEVKWMMIHKMVVRSIGRRAILRHYLLRPRIKEDCYVLYSFAECSLILVE